MTSHPNAEEICDGADNDCDGETDEEVKETFYADADGDGYGDEDSTIEARDEPSGSVADDSDCDDADAAVSPSQIEICNASDDDCDDASCG